MGQIGNYALIVALAMAAFAILSAFLGVHYKRGDLVRSAQNAVYVVFAMVVVAAGSLIYLMVTGDMTYEYVASYTNRDLPLFYKYTFWAGQAGSLLLWSLLLAAYSFAVVYRYRNSFGELMPWVIVVTMATQVFFLALNLFSSNPFDVLVTHHGDGSETLFRPQDGRGLNPLLQHPAMVIHPPTLFVGYVGFAIPFAFAMAALISGQLNDEWIKLSRRWTLFAWLFQSAGIMMGGWWAYEELGWGGYWAWDPVENASLMPWLTGTAFLHSVMIQEKKNMFKVWNVSLIIATYLLCIFGTFLTRSGVVSSVHAFAQGSIGIYFISFITLSLLVSVWFVIKRLPMLKSEGQLDSALSRESSFLFNNLVLLISCFAVLWGTVFPIISEAVTGEKIVVGAPFFNKVNIPIALFLLFLTGAGPLFAWRKTSAASLRKAFLLPTIIALAGGVVIFMFVTQHFYGLMSFVLNIFVAAVIAIEFAKGTSARMRSNGENVLIALKNLTLKNKRRYGGYIVHFGIVVIFVGITGSIFNYETKTELGQGESRQVKDYLLKIDKVDFTNTPNYQSSYAVVSVYKDDKKIDELKPEYRMYRSSQQPTTEVALHKTLKEDLYLVFTGLDDTEKKAVLQIYVNPLVSLVWLGTEILVFGTLICLLPAYQEDRKSVKSMRKEKTLEKA
ncbi:MAG TPA: heme lyase CcmF/NrfE family subunit [bacterium]|nr:heme lyase CcmF/NrfE family subunit [bacterium]HMW32807.1 heme lyase CcmF/NrfE family subunit [bacterium]HMW34894.1 heme lyase CcmF/NrfE family subunit [bacterium]HMY35592.1 heme lyase CcmF/NrfE family subunit [bacterium]HNB10204.1 heme lyase CcmF/NrfE family subunit [bacterium]